MRMVLTKLLGDLLGANVCSDDDASAATRSESDEEDDDGVHGRLPDPSRCSCGSRECRRRRRRGRRRRQAPEGRKAGKRKTKLKKPPSKKKATHQLAVGHGSVIQGTNI